MRGWGVGRDGVRGGVRGRQWKSHVLRVFVPWGRLGRELAVGMVLGKRTVKVFFFFFSPLAFDFFAHRRERER